MVVVFGWGDAKAQDFGEVAPANCPQCHNDVFLHRIRSEKQFSLYFIPLGSYRKDEYLVCPICHFALQIEAANNTAVERMRAMTASFRQGRADPSFYEASVATFWTSVGRNTTGRQIVWPPRPGTLGAKPPVGAMPQQEGPAASRGRSATSPNMTEQLHRLGELHAEGLLTDEEFETAKRRVISG